MANPSDIPTTYKEKCRKADKMDARKISIGLQNNRIEGIHIPEQRMEYIHSLVRYRAKLVRDQTRCKNRIWGIVFFNDLPIRKDRERKNWTKDFIEKLKEYPCSLEIRSILDLAIQELIEIKKLLFSVTKMIRTISSGDKSGKTQAVINNTRHRINQCDGNTN